MGAAFATGNFSENDSVVTPNGIGILEGASDGFNLGKGISTNYCGDIIVIGIPGGINQNEKGKVRVYQWVNTTTVGVGNWTRVGDATELTYDGSGTGYYFGSAISINSNKSNYIPGEKTNLSQVRFIVGSFGADKDNETESGSIFIIAWNGSDWYKMTYNNGSTDYTEIYTEVRSNNSPGNNADGDEFGKSVAMNQDGTIVAVGSPGYDNNNGAIFLYRYNSTTSKWIDCQGDFLAGSNGEKLGSTLGVDINYHGDVIVTSSLSGKNINVYRCTESNSNILSGTAANWTRIFQYTMNSGAHSVSINKDINSNGRGILNTTGTKVIISAGDYLYDSAKGIVKVWECNTADITNSSNTSGWSQVGSDIVGSVDDERLGSSCSLNGIGDYLAVGSYWELDSNGNKIGSSNVYKYENSSWSEFADYDGTVHNEKLGTKISLNGEGFFYLVSAHLFDSGNSAGEGKIVTVRSTANTPNFIAQNLTAVGEFTSTNPITNYPNTIGVLDGINPPLNTEANLGFSVSTNYSGDIIAISAPGNSGGYVIIYQWRDTNGNSNGSWIQKGSALTGENSDDLFGCSLQINSNRGNYEDGILTNLFDVKIIVGAKGVDIGSQLNSGNAYIYEWNGTDWAKMNYYDTTSLFSYFSNYILNNNSESISGGEQFGAAVTLNQNGTIAVISAPEHDYSSDETGAVYIFRYDSGNSRWVNFSGDYLEGVHVDNIGSSLDINYDGDILVVGDNQDDSNKGKVRVYKCDVTTYSSSMNPSWTLIFDREGTIGSYFGNFVSINQNRNTNLPALTITHTVTVKSYEGNNRYYIDGVLLQTLTFKKGNTYKFDQSDSTNGTHPLRLSTTSNGSQYTTGWSDNGGTAGNNLISTFVVPDDSPLILYYYCANHSNMGSKIYVETDIIIAAGAYAHNTNEGFVEVWRSNKLNPSSISDWTQMGTNITGSSGDQLGFSGKLNGDGKKISIGLNTAESNKGQLSIYEYLNDINTSFTDNWYIKRFRKGDANEKLGHSTYINGKGNFIIGGAKDYGTNSPGRIRTTLISSDANLPYDWHNKGSVFFSSATAFNDNLAGEHICINYCGDTLIVGIPGFDKNISSTNYPNTGALYFYQYSNNTWNQKGGAVYEVDSTVISGYLGRSVALNSNRGNNTNSETDLSQIRIIGGQPGFKKAFIYQSNTVGDLSKMTYNNGTTDYTYIAASNHSSQSSNDDSFGDCVAINQDGTVIAIGMPQYSSNKGRIFFYKYNTTSSKWEEYGYTPTHSNQIKMGTSIALNYDGTLLVVGGPEKNTNQGCVIIYIKDDSTTGWISKTTYNSSVSGEYLGKSVSVNMNNNSQGTGTTSEPVTFGNGSTEFIYCGGAPDNSNGKVYVWKYNGSTITQLGNSILGTTSNEKFGSSVSLNGGGNIICVGASGYNSNRGTVRVYNYTNNDWHQIGSDFDGEYENKYLGTSVSLRGDGKLYAAGGPGNETSDTNTQGIVEVKMYGKQDMPCFPEGEVVLTDQGLINIEDITTDNSIDGYRVKMRTRVIFDSKEAGNMLLVQKDALGKDNPNKDTFITQEHGIFVKHEDTEFVRARELVDGDKVKIVQKDYVYVHTIILHDVHHHMFVNNMKCETTPWRCRPKCKENFFSNDIPI